jgi:nucleotide-binding universal stress UspA family protein
MSVLNEFASRIVAATDFSTDAGNAVGRAAMLARRHGLELELLHVVSRSSLDAVREWVRLPTDFADRLVEDARQALEQAAGSAGTPASARVAVGDVLDEIVSSCTRACLLAVGAHGLDRLRDAILGTTAERLVGRSEFPILVVRKPPRQEYRNVLVAVDLRPGAENVLAIAPAIAPDAKLAAVHAFDVPFEGTLQRVGVPTREIDQHRAAGFRKALDAIRGLSATVSGDAGAFLPIVERGHAARLILEHAHALGADLVAIGKRRRSPTEALLLGSVARHVLADAGCDVLVVPLERA